MVLEEGVELQTRIENTQLTDSAIRQKGQKRQIGGPVVRSWYNLAACRIWHPLLTSPLSHSDPG